MKILIIDRDEAHTQQMSKRLESMGYDVLVESKRDVAAQTLARENVGLVFIDPAPLSEPKQAISALRNAAQSNPYIVMMGHEAKEDWLSTGVNIYIEKPLSGDTVESTALHAANFINLKNKLANIDKDFPSGGGIIAKSAFNELFLSAIELADRRGDSTYCLFIGIENYKEILASESEYSIKQTTARLAHTLAKVRRQSDILAQTDDAEYVIMFLGASKIDEPEEATHRFIETFSSMTDMTSGEVSPVELSFHLIEIPTGVCYVEKIFRLQSPT